MPTKYLDEEGLSHVVRRAKETFAEKKELWNWQKTEKAGAVAFEPVPDSVLEPVVEFKFKETLPAEGEKGPSNPSTIEGISNVRIVRCGKNIITYPYLDRSCVREGITFTVNNDGSVVVNGTATDYAHFYISSHGTKVRLCQGQTYFLSGVPAGYDNNLYLLYECYTLNHTYDRNYQCYSNGLTINPTSDCLGFFQILVKPGTTVDNAVIYPQLELGSCSTEYELPNSININYPVNSCYGGSLDVNSGLLTVTWESKNLTGTEEWSIQSQVGDTDTFNTFQSQLDLERNVMTDDPSPTTRFCSHFSYSLNNQNYESYYTWAGATNVLFRRLKSEFPDVNSFRSWIASEYNAGHPVVIGYKLRSPYTIQLDPIQIKSLASLDKYDPRINIVYTDAESIQVGYQKFTASEKGINDISLRETSSTVRNEIHPVNPTEWGMAYDLYNGSYCLHGDIDFYDASGNEIALSTGYTVSEPDTQSVTINFPNVVPKTINGYIAICQGNCDYWSSISFDNVSIEDILNAGVDGLLIQGGFLFSNWGGPYPYPNDTDAVVYMTDNGNGSYTMKFATCTSSEATYPECHIENADGTNESLNLDILYNHVGGQIIDDTNTYLPLWVDQSETPTLPIFDLYDMMSFGFIDSNGNQISFDSYSYASDGKSVIVDFGNYPFPTKLMPAVSYFTEESLSNEEIESMYAMGIETTSMGWWNPISISLDEAFGMSNGILLHEYSYYDDPPVLLSDITIRLLVERVSETAIKLSVVQPNENGSIKLHLESASSNDIDLAPLAGKTVSSVSLKNQVLQPQMHSNDDANSYDISIEFYDGNEVYLNGNSLNMNDFTCDNIQTQIDPSAEYIKIEYTEYYSGHLCAEYSTDLISISELKKGKFLSSYEANRYYAI